MHALKLSCGRQSLVSVRCSNSQEKRPRSRKSKEERRKMVESFIKKYQSLNNGNFPSLNLTHKEVGGSFYIVREIVRDIIQENKVLRPGNPTSKALTLENCVEDQQTEYFSSDVANQLTISTFGNAIDRNQAHINSHSKEHPISDKESYEEANLDVHEVLETYSSEFSLSHSVEHSKSLNTYKETVVEGYFIDAEYDKEDVGRLTSPTEASYLVHRASVMHELGKPCQSSYPVSVSLSSSSHKMRSEQNNMISKEDSSVEDIPEDIEPESKILESTSDIITSDELQYNLSLFAAETFPVVATETDTSNIETSILEEEKSNSSVVPVTHSPSEANGECLVINEISCQNESDPSEIVSPLVIQVTTDLINPTSESSSSTMLDSLESEQVRDDLNVLNGTNSSSISSPVVNEISCVEHADQLHLDNKSEHDCMLQQKEMIPPEENPILTAFKAFVAAFIKFWTE